MQELQLLSSIEEQLEYQRNVPHVNITGELICAWFDDSYWPEDKIFIAGFSEEELKAMAKFNEVYENVLASNRVEELPQITTLVQTPEWAHLAQAAREALNVFRHQADK